MTAFDRFSARFYTFTGHMRRAFQEPKHADLPNWNDQPREYAVVHAEKAFQDLIAATRQPETDYLQIRHHAANAANWCMILADYWNHPNRRKDHVEKV
jgi:hypothetical protein